MACKKLHFTETRARSKQRIQASSQIRSILQEFNLSDTDDDDGSNEKEPQLASLRVRSSITPKQVNEKEARQDTIVSEKTRSNQEWEKLKSRQESSGAAFAKTCEQLAVTLTESNKTGKGSQADHTEKKSEVTRVSKGHSASAVKKKPSGTIRPNVARGKENVETLASTPLSASPRRMTGSKLKPAYKQGFISQPKKSLACQNMTLASLGISFDLSDSSDEEKHTSCQKDDHQISSKKEEVNLQAGSTCHLPSTPSEITSIQHTDVQGDIQAVKTESNASVAEVTADGVCSELEKMILNENKDVGCKASPQSEQLSSKCLIKETVTQVENFVDARTGVNKTNSPFCLVAETVEGVACGTEVKSEVNSGLKNIHKLPAVTDEYSPAMFIPKVPDTQHVLDTDVSMVRSSSDSQCFFADADESTGILPLSESTRLDFAEGTALSVGHMYPQQDSSHFVSSLNSKKDRGSKIGKLNEQCEDSRILIKNYEDKIGDFKLTSKEIKVERATDDQRGIVNLFSPTATSTRMSGRCSRDKRVKSENSLMTTEVDCEKREDVAKTTENEHEKREAVQLISSATFANKQNASGFDNSDSVSNSQYLSCLSTPEDHSYYEAVDVATQTSFVQTTVENPASSPGVGCEGKSEKTAQKDKEEHDDAPANEQEHVPAEKTDEDVPTNEQEHGLAEEDSSCEHSSRNNIHSDPSDTSDGNRLVGSPNQVQASAEKAEDGRTKAADLANTSDDWAAGDSEKTHKEKRSEIIQPAAKRMEEKENFRRRQPSDSSSDDDGDAKLEAFFQKLRTPAKPVREDSGGSLSDFIVNDSDVTESDEDICYADISRRLDFEETAARKSKKPVSQRTGSSSARKKRSVVSFSSSSESDSDGCEETDDSASDNNEAFNSPSPPQALSSGGKQTPEAGELKWYTPATSIKTKPRRDLTCTPSIKSISTVSVPGRLQTSTFATPLLSGRSEKSADLKPYSFLKSLSADVADQRRDPEARRFITQFKQRQVELSSRLFKLFNSSVFDNQLPVEMPLIWNKRLLKTAGRCKEKRIGSKREAAIELSVKVCDSAERVRDTLVHEMCHAAVWLISGVREGHGPHWKYWARKANRAHPEIPIIQRCHDYNISTKYIYRCIKCGYQIGRHSKSLDTEKKVCGKCHGQFQLLLAPAGGNSMASDSSACPNPRTPQTPNRFAMFVKENYGSVKKQGLSHKEVMNLLSKDFAEKNKI